MTTTTKCCGEPIMVERTIKTYSQNLSINEEYFVKNQQDNSWGDCIKDDGNHEIDEWNGDEEIRTVLCSNCTKEVNPSDCVFYLDEEE